MADTHIAAPPRGPRPEKVAAVADLAERLRRCEALILTEYRGLKVPEQQQLRRALRDVGAEYKVVKCTLARRAAVDAGLDDLVDQLTGPLALVFTDGDPAAAAKALVEFSKANSALVVHGGVLSSRLIAEADTKALAELPPRDVLLGQIAGTIQSPVQKTATLLAAPLQKLAGLVDALIRRGEDLQEPVQAQGD
jgi:large subunit ribosomal protein L10